MKLVLWSIVVIGCAAPQGGHPLQSGKDVDGDGIPDVRDKCAYEPGPDINSGCPQQGSTIEVETSGTDTPTTSAPPPPTTPAPPVGADRDGDGIGDANDRCPDEPEDLDGFEDSDGCPDVDNDQDGVLDVDDQCPNDPETKNQVADADGCPD